MLTAMPARYSDRLLDGTRCVVSGNVNGGVRRRRSPSVPPERMPLRVNSQRPPGCLFATAKGQQQPNESTERAESRQCGLVPCEPD